MKQKIESLIEKGMIRDVLYVYAEKFREACEVSNAYVKHAAEGRTIWWSDTYNLQVMSLSEISDGVLVDTFRRLK